MDEIRNQSIKLFSEWLDKQTNFTTSIKIVCGQGFESIYDDYISRFISRRPELVKLNEKLVKKAVGEALEIGRFTGGAFIGTDEKIAKHICAKFSAPEAKQRDVKWPEKDCLPLELQHHKESGLFNEIRNSAIDACKKAYEEAQPASSVNAEVVEALRGLVDDEECSFDHHGYCQTHFSGSMPCLMEKARKALKKVGYD